jgi:hypothetical protein
MKSLQTIAEDLMLGSDPETLAQEVGWDRLNEAIDMLSDRV